MKKIILILFVAITSCKKDLAENASKTVVDDVATIISAEKVYEPNGEIGRRITFTTSIFTAIELKVYKGVKMQTYWSNFSPTLSFIDHYAGYGEIYYTFKWEYSNGTERWQEPQKTTLQ